MEPPGRRNRYSTNWLNNSLALIRVVVNHLVEWNFGSTRRSLSPTKLTCRRVATTTPSQRQVRRNDWFAAATRFAAPTTKSGVEDARPAPAAVSSQTGSAAEGRRRDRPQAHDRPVLTDDGRRRL